MMNRVILLSVAVFLSCQYSVGHGIDKNIILGNERVMIPEEFNRLYLDEVKPAISEQTDCNDMTLTYLAGSQQVCIRLKTSLFLFCSSD